MEFIDFMNMRLEEVNIKTYVAYKSNINVNMKKFFGSSKDDENDSSQENEISKTDKQERNKDKVFTSEVYTMEELNKLLEIMKDDFIEIPVLLAAYYGLRRSEAVGLK